MFYGRSKQKARSSKSIVILSNAKDLALGSCEILRCAQNDKG